MDSFLKILESEKTFAGASGCLEMYVIVLTVVWVLSIACSAISLDHLPPHPVEPVSPPFSWILLTVCTRSSYELRSNFLGLLR